MSSIILGTFNAESYWQDRQAARLPAITDEAAGRVITAMDELQAVFCTSAADLVLTALEPNTALLDYLSSLGYPLSKRNCKGFNGQLDSAAENDNIFRLLVQTPYKKELGSLLKQSADLSPYAIIPDTHSFLQSYELTNSLPQPQAVRAVNSKLFSHRIAQVIVPPARGQIVDSADELLCSGKRLLAAGPFLIKDPYGVAGKGLILIHSLKVLQRVVKHLKKQEERDLVTQFLLEPYRSKKSDFSCHLRIEPNGDYKIIAYLQLFNHNFSFCGIKGLDAESTAFLNAKGYHKQVAKAATLLFAQGYFGPVCIDSMILHNNEIIPIVEINARKSMGLIHIFMDRFLAQYNRRGKLICLPAQLESHLDFSTLLAILDRDGLLFRKDRPRGVLPCSANTLLVNALRHKLSRSSAKAYGRFYLSLVAEQAKEEEMILGDLIKTLQKLGILVKSV